ncbi:MAG: glycosyltransferase [Bacteroidales bacterium]|nr:glycosyltransferase [Bacteroidales bacterium]
MPELPLITVITVCHNDADVVEQTIRSVLEQQYPKMNYIVWDGCSTDGTLDIVKKYDERLSYWTSEPNNGTYDAMNRAAKKAVELAGTDRQWLFFLYAGDRFPNEKVLAQVFSMERQDFDALRMIGGGVLREKKNDEGTLLEAAKPIDVIPLEPAFGVASSFIRADVCRFDLDYPLGADYALQYKLYHEVGSDSIAAIDLPVVVMQEEERDARLLNQRIVKGEYLGVQSQHISWRWVKEYFKWRFLG